MNPVIMTVFGGPRRDGFSAEMLRRFTREFQAEFVGYDAYERNYAPCTDCRYCRDAEGCCNDDMDGFFADFEACDGIILASPVYNMSFPAPMKAILDRMQRYYSARFFLDKRPPVAKRRPVTLLLSAGSPDEKGDIAARQLEQIFTVTNCELTGRVVLSGTDGADDLPALIDTVAPEIRSEAEKFRKAADDITFSSHNS
ncbi:MAG: flavodoxin family protein [Clostridia bacterium]|nr:flavodoxin family protein [Clostridia bacterium]